MKRIYKCKMCPERITFKQKFCSPECAFISGRCYVGETKAEYLQRKKKKWYNKIKKVEKEIINNKK